MKDVIYLTVNRSGVQQFRKSYTGARRGEVIVKLNVEVPEKAFSGVKVSISRTCSLTRASLPRMRQP
jgi:hypothetical protein